MDDATDDANRDAKDDVDGEASGGVRDDEATAAPDPRDRRKGERRRGGDPGAASAGDRRASDRRSVPGVPEQYRGNVRSINEYPLDGDELEFINAINAYKQRYGRPFPTWSEVLHVLRFLGYRKPAAPDAGAEAPGEPGAADQPQARDR